MAHGQPTRIAVIGGHGAAVSLVQDCLQTSFEHEWEEIVGGVEFAVWNGDATEKPSREFGAENGLSVAVFPTVKQLVNWAELCTAFWDGEDAETWNTIREMSQAGRYVEIVPVDRLQKTVDEQAGRLLR